MVGGKLYGWGEGGLKSYEIEIIWQNHTRCKNGRSVRLTWFIMYSCHTPESFQSITLDSISQSELTIVSPFVSCPCLGWLCGWDGGRVIWGSLKAAPRSHFLFLNSLMGTTWNQRALAANSPHDDIPSPNLKNDSRPFKGSSRPVLTRLQFLRLSEHHGKQRKGHHQDSESHKLGFGSWLHNLPLARLSWILFPYL